MGSISINDDKIIGGSKSITASTILAPPCDMNLSLDTANITLTLEGGAFIGQKLSVVANAASSLVYTGVNGTTTEGLASGKKAILTWTGSYWLCSVSVVIQGKNATGAAFEYSGGLSVEAVPGVHTKTITINESIITPTAFDERIIFNINQSGSSAILNMGIASYQTIKLTNINSNPVNLTYNGVGGVTSITLYQGTSIVFTWAGTYWSPYIGTDEPIPVTSDITISPKVPMSLVGASPYVCITVGDGPYPGYRLPIMTHRGGGTYTFVKFKNEADMDVCVCIFGKGFTLIWDGTNWAAEDGASFIMSDSVYAHRPAGTKPSDWKVSAGTYGTYYFVYIGTGGEDYDIPTVSSNMTVTVYSRGQGTMRAIALQNYATAGYENLDYPIFSKVANQGVWGNHWTRFDGGPGNGAYVSDNPINTGRLASGGYIHKTTLNGVCYVHIYGLYTTSSTAQWYTVGSGFPVPWFGSFSFTTQSGNSLSIDSDGYLNMYRANANQINTTFSYPIKR